MILKRCEFCNEKSLLKDKKMICIAAAGGSGEGTKDCLHSMKLLARFLKMKVIDSIGVTKANISDQKLKIIQSIKKL